MQISHQIGAQNRMIFCDGLWLLKMYSLQHRRWDNWSEALPMTSSALMWAMLALTLPALQRTSGCCPGTGRPSWPMAAFACWPPWDTPCRPPEPSLSLSSHVPGISFGMFWMIHEIHQFGQKSKVVSFGSSVHSSSFINSSVQHVIKSQFISPRCQLANF